MIKWIVTVNLQPDQHQEDSHIHVDAKVEYRHESW